MLDFAQARRHMVENQLRTFDVNDLRVLAAFESVPRELFVPAGREGLAYIDQDLPVSDGLAVLERRSMLAPMVLARMIQALNLDRGDKVLDVACGLGYSSAIMARLGASVVALESSPVLVEAARERLAAVGAEGVVLAQGLLEEGCREAAPFDAILVNGSINSRPDVLLGQLAEGGRLVAVRGRGRAGSAVLFVRAGEAFGSRSLFDAVAPVLDAFREEPGFVF
jgi:protein-L-isoaspartate(D-aspartate) O-methyltransferase